jgi:hypothetical protein
VSQKPGAVHTILKDRRTFGATDIGVLQGKLFGFGLQKGPIEAGLQDRPDGRHRPRLDRHATAAGSIKAFRLKALGQ